MNMVFRRATLDDGRLVVTLAQTYCSDSKDFWKWTKSYAAEGPNSATHRMKEGTQRSLSFIEPMKALPVEKLPEGDWLYEIKFDGYRPFKEGK